MHIQFETPLTTAFRPNLLPVVRALPADLETPVSVYLKLAGEAPSFLLESVTGGEQVARYSFIGVNPSRAYILRDGRLELHSLPNGEVTEISGDEDPMLALRREISRFRPLPFIQSHAKQSVKAAAGFTPPRFTGGLVGYLGYEAAATFESSVPALNAEGELPPDAIFLLADTIVAFDHAFGNLLLIANMPLDGEALDAEEAALIEAESRLDVLQARLEQPTPGRNPLSAPPLEAEMRSNMSRDEFVRAVEVAKEYIAAGDIFQVVLSQRFSRQTGADPFSLYRSLRRLNPSPYMFYFDFSGLAGDEPLRLIGASPEMHVRLEVGSGQNGEHHPVAAIRPIAGTRPRGATPDQDLTNEEDLLADPKERAEHIMLVDLARNDLGRVCVYGSVTTPELMGIERYSHVMHIVSQVEGRLKPDFDGFDLMRATFPAGTVTGAPKIRAMQIIAELEGRPRGPYAGAVGYFSFDGSLDTCITIRTLVMQGQTVHLQAGAGIVADSDPEREYQETLNKARALAQAVEIAEKD